jgi:hypothetical protein
VETEADVGAETDTRRDDDRRAADAGDETETLDVVATYATVRRELREEFDIDTARTSREFYHACRMQGLDDERLAALERLTQAYETVQYSDNPNLNVAELRAAAAQFGMGKAESA